jgi:exosortase
MRTTDIARLALFEERRLLPLIALLAALWPVWVWLGRRTSSDPTEAWALLSLVTAVAFIWRDRTRIVPEHASGASPRIVEVRTGGRWGVPIVLLLIYAASYLFVPPLVRALVALSAISAACSEIYLGKRMDVRLLGLLLLSLPLIPTLNFYLGYPLRVVVGEMTSALLHMNGFAATREGTILLWGEQRISIDAPCSGIKMLWTGMYLSCALAALQRLDAKRTLVLGVIALVIVILANVLRAAALFYVEAGIVPEAQSAHSRIGAIVFIFAAGALAAIATRLRATAHAK